VKLRPYQQSIVDSLLAPPAGISRSLVTAATGSGKTVVFSAFLDAFLKQGQRALIIAHRDELISQAITKLAETAPSFHIEREQAGDRASHSISGWSKSLHKIDRSVVVATIQTLKGKRLAAWPRDTFACVIVDEAHHSVAKAYIDALKHFGCIDGETRLIGVTATPGRTDGVGLGFVYQEIAADWGIRELVKLGWLAPVHCRVITSKVSLDGIKTRAGDFEQGALEERVDVSARNELVVSAYEEHAAGEKTIVFAAGVSHAHHIADLFRARGHVAEPIWGAMEKDKRAETLAGFHDGSIPILTNYGVLTEGFDAPGTSCIILARPTKSSLVVAQCIGRGTRIAPGKEKCLVLDVRDCTAGKNLATAASLAGLPPKFDAKGENLITLGEDFEALPPALQSTAIDSDQLGKFVKKIKEGMSVAEIDLFSVLHVDPDDRKRSSLAWQKIDDEAWTLSADKVRYVVHVDTLGRYAFTREGRILAVENRMETAFAYADSWITKQHETASILLDLSKPWRKQPASEAQMKVIKRLAKQEINTKLSKGDAAVLISSLKENHA
jgi:superfamily II DNA or RNA helicase